MSKISVLGSLNMDLVTSVDRAPNMGETVLGESFKTVCGGKGGNQAMAIARLGGNIEMLGCVGNDSYGKILKENLNNDGAKTDNIEEKEASSGIAAITVSGGDNCIIVVKGANDLVTKEYVDTHKNVIEESDYLVMQLEIPFETVEYAMKSARESNTKVVFNPAPMDKKCISLIPYVDIFVVNEHEAGIVTGETVVTEKDAEIAIKKLLEIGAKTVIVTLGEKGCVYNSGNEFFHTPAVKTKAIDSTAAGDSFIGAMLVKLTEGADMKEATEFASKVSSIVVSRLGATESIPYRKDIE